MKAKELKVLRKLLVKANRCEAVLEGLESKTTFGLINDVRGLDNENTAKSERASPGEQTYLSIRFFLSKDIKEKRFEECFDLFQRNMGDMYRNSSWGLDLEEKAAELRNDKARFLLVTDSDEKLVAFVHFRFEYDDDENPSCAVLYIYEIQVESMYRRHGVGKRLMGIAEHIAREQSMTKVLLTVFKKNEKAMNFYRKALGYDIDASSPSKFGEQSVDYEILSLHVR